ncbi:MAG: peptide-methionine (R)-S-oxide reductase MsrB [Aquimonas sp.]|nr:peptide-methionine (R)-S-oxide reductase MsrB [Aquimonas sp.]
MSQPDPPPTWAQILSWARRGNPPPPRRLDLDEDDWRARLTPDQYRVLRQHGTERPFSSQMCGLFEPGRYACAGCGTSLFDATSKFESHSGWPSFTAPVAEGVVAYVEDLSHGMQRVETLCAVCDGHLGHVFPDGPLPTGLRYCINAIALQKEHA